MWLPVQESGFKKFIAWMTFNSVIQRFCESQCLYRGIIKKSVLTMRAAGWNSDLPIFEGVPATWPPAGKSVEEIIKLGTVEDCLQKMAAIIFFPFSTPLCKMTLQLCPLRDGISPPLESGLALWTALPNRTQQKQYYASSESRSQKAWQSFTLLLEISETHMNKP